MRILIIIAALMVVGCGGSDSPTAPTNSQLNIAGTWVGTATDQFGSGAARVTFSQSGNSVSGTWSVTSGATSNSGSITGTSAGTSVNLSLIPSDPRTCGFTVTANVSGGNRMSGSYASASCTVAIAGTMTLLKQ